MTDQLIVDKVKKMCVNHFDMVERTIELIKNTPKPHRPINHKEVLNSWEKAVEEYKLSLNK